MNDWIAFLICIIYVFGMIGVAESLRRRRGYSSGFTRKVIHIGVGMLSWALPFLFSTPWFFIVACVAFMFLNLLDWRFGFFAAMASSDRSNLGTVYFPLAAGVVALIFWTQPALMVAALMPLTWGDGLAPVVGQKFGWRSYRVHQTTRTVEGSAAFLVAAFFFTWLALWGMKDPPSLTPFAAFAPALVIAIATTMVEAVSIWGIDNLSVTTVAVLVLSTWPFV